MGRLHSRMEQDLILKGLSPSSRRNYLLYCHRFAAHHRRSPDQMGEAGIRTLLLHLIQIEQVCYAAYGRWRRR